MQKTEEAILRPLFLYWRRKHLQAYLAECAASGRPPGLNVGCGPLPMQGWFNCDLTTMSRAVNFLDATERLPFEDETFEYAFSEHFIEHLSFEHGKRFFQEAHRVLRPGGILRTATPSLEFVRDMVELRTEGHRRYMEWHVGKFNAGRPVDPAVVINQLFYGHGHRFIYSPSILERVLREVGFRDFKVCRPGQSDVPGLSGLEKHGMSVPPEFNELETMVLEARK